MNITTKFDINQQVWFICGETPKIKCEITKHLPRPIHDPENEMIDPDKRFCEAERSIFMAKIHNKAIEDEFNNDCA